MNKLVETVETVETSCFEAIINTLVSELDNAISNHDKDDIKRLEAEISQCNFVKVKAEVRKEISGKLEDTLDKIEEFKENQSDENSWTKLGQVSRIVTVEALGLNKALKGYIKVSKDVLTGSQLEVLTFSNCVEFINNSIKYKDLKYFTTNDIKLICQKVIVNKDPNTARALKVAKQGGTIGAKADNIN
jgi:hypothetical protein